MSSSETVRAVRTACRAAAPWAACVALVLQAAACNNLLGLNDVRRLPVDGGDGQVGGAASTGGAAGGGDETGGGGTGGVADAGDETGGGGAGGAVCERELSRNGFFDLGRTQWSIGASEPAELIFRYDATELTTPGIAPLSGQWALRLGGVRAEDKYLTHYVEQRMIIPANASEVTVSGYVQVRTSEDFEADYDTSGFLLFDDGHPPPEVPFYRSQPDPTWSNRTAQTATTWTMFRQVVDVRAKAGSAMMFRVIAELDPTNPSYFFFDNVSVAVTACAP